MARVIGKDNKVMALSEAKKQRFNNYQLIIMIIVSVVVLGLSIGLIVKYTKTSETVDVTYNEIIQYMLDYQAKTLPDDRKIFEVTQDNLFIIDSDLPTRYYVYIYNSNYEESVESSNVEDYVVSLFDSILTLDDVKIYIIDLADDTNTGSLTTNIEFSDEDEMELTLTAPMILEVNMDNVDSDTLDAIRDISENTTFNLSQDIYEEMEKISAE